MSGEDVNEDASYLLVIKVVPIDAGSVALLKAHFADEDVAHSKAFTGVETLAIIGKFTAQSLLGSNSMSSASQKQRLRLAEKRS
jgi:hypothetical protein